MFTDNWNLENIETIVATRRRIRFDKLCGLFVGNHAAAIVHEVKIQNFFKVVMHTTLSLRWSLAHGTHSRITIPQLLRRSRVRLIGQNGTIAGAMWSPRLVKKVLNTLGKQLVDDGRLDSVSLYSAGPRADFPELDTQEWQEDDYDQQGNLFVPVKVKEGKREEIDWVLKQKLFDYVLESERAERQGRPYSMKWVLKNEWEKVRAGLVVREIKRVKSEDEKLEPSDVFSAMPQVESLKPLVSHLVTERVRKRGRNSVHTVFDLSRAHFYGVCERDVYVENHQNCIVLDSWPNSTKPCTGRKRRAMRGRNCCVNTSAAMALSPVQAVQRCTDQSLLMDSVTETILCLRQQRINSRSLEICCMKSPTRFGMIGAAEYLDKEMEVLHRNCQSDQ